MPAWTGKLHVPRITHRGAGNLDQRQDKDGSAFYVGVASDLTKRAWEHRKGFAAGNCRRYKINRLVYFEAHESAMEAINREMRIKKWRRAWKIRLIESLNPEWRNLFRDLA